MNAMPLNMDSNITIPCIVSVALPISFIKSTVFFSVASDKHLAICKESSTKECLFFVTIPLINILLKNLPTVSS